MNRAGARWLIAGIAALTAVGGAAIPAQAQSGRQRDKNNMRNLGAVLGAAAAYEITHGKTTEAVALGAGAVYAGKKYEDARKAQSTDNRWRGSWAPSRYQARRDGQSQPKYYRRQNNENRDNDERRHDNGRHQGEYKNKNRDRD